MESAIAFTLLVLLFSLVVSAGEFINYGIGLDNAASSAARAAAQQADLGTGSPTTAAVTAVNQEQNVSSWSACGGTPAPPCVSVSSATQSTGTTTSITVEQVTLHGTFTPLFSILGLTIPITVNAGAST